MRSRICVNCAYNPYCGVVPAHSHKSVIPSSAEKESNLCAVHKGILDYLFEKIAAGDPTTMATLKRWTTIRVRDHCLQVPAGLP